MKLKGDIKVFQDRQGIFDGLEVNDAKFEIMMVDDNWLDVRGSYGGDEILFQIKMSAEELENLKEILEKEAEASQKVNQVG